LTLARLQLLQVNLGAVVLGVPSNAFDEDLERARYMVVPLVDVAVNIIDDW
jgi:hypothetical protein